MKSAGRIKRFENLGFGLFVHFGLYSVLGKGEWAKNALRIPDGEYEGLTGEFRVREDWAKKLSAAAKNAGCKYITLTARHHDGFSLYDTHGFSVFDAPHSACGRDLVAEFVSACRGVGLVPFLYHTLIDWRMESKFSSFSDYLDYLRASVELLCRNYGELGGFWFDGMWAYPDRDWEEDTLYRMIRKYQPEAVLINNTGLNALGALGHIELDSVTFERGKPQHINGENAPKYLASEMCQTLNDHWAYTAEDCNYKSTGRLIRELVDCRRYGSNFLLNVGPRGDGSLGPMEEGILERLGVWMSRNRKAIYEPRPSAVKTDSEENFVLEDGEAYYVFLHDVPMSADPNVAKGTAAREECLLSGVGRIGKAEWLDSGEEIALELRSEGIAIPILPFEYGKSYCVRVAKIEKKRG